LRIYGAGEINPRVALYSACFVAIFTMQVPLRSSVAVPKAGIRTSGLRAFCHFPNNAIGTRPTA
jgi:hypothetical protein